MQTAGREWAQIGAVLGESPEAVRKRYERAFGRLSQELERDKVHHA